MVGLKKYSGKTLFALIITMLSSQAIADERYPELSGTISRPIQTQKAVAYKNAIPFDQLMSIVGKSINSIHAHGSYYGPYAEHLGKQKLAESADKLRLDDKIRRYIHETSVAKNNFFAPYHLHCQFKFDGRQYNKPSKMYVFKAIFRYSNKDYNNPSGEIDVETRPLVPIVSNAKSKPFRAELLAKIIPIDANGNWVREDRGNNFNYRPLTPFLPSGLNSELSTYPYLHFKYTMPDNKTTKHVLATPIGYYSSLDGGKSWVPGC